MSNPMNCECACPVPATINTPGIQGQNAWTVTTDPTGTFVVPALGNQVTLDVASTTWMAVGLNVFLQGLGTFTVAAINSPTSVLLTYLNILTNTQAGSPIPLGTLIVPSGVPGIAGLNAYTIVAGGGFTVPSSYGAPVAIPVGNAQWMTVGQSIYVQGAGNFVITSIDNGAVPNPLVVATYPNVAGNVNLSAVISAGAGVSASAFEPLLPAIPGYRLTKIVYITGATTSYTPTAGTNAILVEAIGGGGSGGGSDTTGGSESSYAGGGGSGAFSSVFISTPAVSYAVQVGAGGAAPTAGTNAGNAGTDTTFAETATPLVSLCTAKAGTGGSAGMATGSAFATAQGGAGGITSTGIGDILFAGNCGGIATRGSGTSGISGQGAPSAVGGGILGVQFASADGATGGNYGAGGSGAGSTTGGGPNAGGAGAGGMIRVTEFVL